MNNVILPGDQILSFMRINTGEVGLPSVETFKNNMNVIIQQLNLKY